MKQFKDIDVDVKNWNASVGKIEDKYNDVEVYVKLGILTKNESKSA